MTEYSFPLLVEMDRPTNSVKLHYHVTLLCGGAGDVRGRKSPSTLQIDLSLLGHT